MKLNVLADLLNSMAKEMAYEINIFLKAVSTVSLRFKLLNRLNLFNDVKLYTLGLSNLVDIISNNVIRIKDGQNGVT